MANPSFKDAAGTTQLRKGTGDGSAGDPFVLHDIVDAVTPGTAADNLGKAEDAVHTSGDVGVMALVVRKDAPVAGGANGDYVALGVNSDGRLYVTTDGTVSITGSAAVTGPLTDAQLRATAVPVSLTSTTITGTVAATQSGTWNVTVNTALPAGSNNIGDVDILSIAAGTNLIGDFGIGVRTGSGGLTGHTAVSAASNNATSVKNSAGRVYAIIATNNGAAARYLKFYNKASAPSPASDTPVATYMLPAGGGLCRITDIGLVFSTGIAYAIVAGIGVTNNTSISADEVAVNIEYA